MFAFLRGSKRGESMAWMAIVMCFLMPPLMGITIDVTRGMYVRTHLQTATDAGCQAAADALNVQLFLDSGVASINEQVMSSQASEVFNATLRDSGKVRFTPSLSLKILTPTSVECTATAPVARFLPSVVPPMNIRVQTVSEMRAHSQP